MEDSMKGVLITSTLIFIFMLGVLSFVTQFPIDQGASLTQRENETYLVISGFESSQLDNSLDTIKGDSDNGLNEFDLEVGFMGSNAVKGSRVSILDQIKLVTTQVSEMSEKIFGKNSPVTIVVGLLITMVIIYFGYIAIKFWRTGS